MPGDRAAHTHPMGATIQQRLGEHVLDTRKALRLSKVDFALQMGISRVSLDLLEQGKANVRLSTLDNLASRMGVEPWQLIK